MDPLSEAEARAERNGLRVETFDCALAPAWTGAGMAGVRLVRGSEIIAFAALSYRGDGARERALRFCAERVFNTPARAD